MPIDYLIFSRDPAELEHKAKQISNIACPIRDAIVYDEALARAQALLDAARRGCGVPIGRVNPPVTGGVDLKFNEPRSTP